MYVIKDKKKITKQKNHCITIVPKNRNHSESFSKRGPKKLRKVSEMQHNLRAGLSLYRRSFLSFLLGGDGVLCIVL